MVQGIEPAEHLPMWMGGPIDELSAISGLPSDQLRMVACLLAAIPIGWFHRVLPTATLKHLVSMIVGAFFCWFVVGNSAYCVPVSAILVYIIVQVVPRTIAPVLVFVASVAWLSAWHIYRLYTDYMGWSLDATLILMVWTVKACTFAYNIADGQALNEGLKLSERESTHIFRSERALTKLPSLLEYFSYVFFFGGVLVGPCFEAKEYFDFIDGSILKKHKLASIPSTILPTLKCLGVGLLMYVGLAISGMYPILGYETTDAFGNLPLFTKFVYFTIAITSSRFKYYFAWKIGEAGCIATGFGLNGVTTDPKTGVTTYSWDRVTNCNALAVETAPHMTDVTNNWNMGVNNWLKNYVYFRVEAPRWVRALGMPQKSFTNLVTKATSAFWHGFYPSYYVFFFGAWLAGEMDDAMRASFEPEQTPEAKKARAKSWWKGPSNVYELCSFLITQSVLNFWGTCFVLLRADYSYEFAKRMYFFGVWVPIVVAFVCRTLFRRRKPNKETLSVETRTTAQPSPSPEATVVTEAGAISTYTPNPAPPKHDNVRAKPVKQAEPVVIEEDDALSPAERVKLRPKRSRSNKAE